MYVLTHTGRTQQAVPLVLPIFLLWAIQREDGRGVAGAKEDIRGIGIRGIRVSHDALDGKSNREYTLGGMAPDCPWGGIVPNYQDRYNRGAWVIQRKDGSGVAGAERNRESNDALDGKSNRRKSNRRDIAGSIAGNGDPERNLEIEGIAPDYPWGGIVPNYLSLATKPPPSLRSAGPPAPPVAPPPRFTVASNS
jgi:hypothetical protein